MKRFKWEPMLIMVLLFILGVALIARPGAIQPRDGARTIDLRIGSSRGVVEVYTPAAPGEQEFRILFRDGTHGEAMSAGEFRERFGDGIYNAATISHGNVLFRIFNITTWSSLAWILLGFGGQLAFTGRMLVQWFVSEKEKQSVVPESFWWLSLFGGAALFAYFVWRHDIVAVLGQSSGVVIYARNLRLIYEQRRRERLALASQVNP